MSPRSPTTSCRPRCDTADHSMPYTVAVALIHGDVGDEHFDAACYCDPQLRALTRLVKVAE